MYEPLIQVFQNKMKDARHTILVHHYVFGQYRIQLTDTQIPDESAPSGHGKIVREMCTYNITMVGKVIEGLCAADDPEAYAESLARSWNCEGKGGRIRLDTKHEDNPHRAKEQEHDG